MKTPLAELKLKRDLAVLEVEMTEQRIEFMALIWKARQLILTLPYPRPPGVKLREDEQAWIEQTDKYLP